MYLYLYMCICVDEFVFVFVTGVAGGREGKELDGKCKILGTNGGRYKRHNDW